MEIHVPGGDAEEQVRPAEGLERLGTVPVRLGNDADAESLRLQHPPDDRHAEAGVIDVSVAGDHDDVAAIPAQRVHFCFGHGQEGGRAEAAGPVAAVGRYVACGFHEGRGVYRGA